MKLSVITICYNAADVLTSTIESVLAQDHDDFEYIIQDGESTDDTPNIVESYREKFAARNIRFVYNRVKDGGIYDAMNRGFSSAEGKYINYMNAGDCFYDSTVLSAVSAVTDRCIKPPAIVYGDCAVYEYGMFFMFQKDADRIEEMMPFSHQTVFARADILRDHPFNTSYRYSADYDFLLTVHDLKESFLDSGTVVCITTADGTSSIHYHDTLMESAKILKAHGLIRSFEALAKSEKMLIVKQFVMDHFPVAIKKWIRARQIASRGQKAVITVPPWFDS